MVRSRLGRFGSEAGFTLIELLVVTTIIILLTVFALPVYASAIDKARRADSLEDRRVIEQALEAYHANTGHFPESLYRLIETGYLKDTSPDHKSLKSPWYTDRNPIWYFYAVDLPEADTAQAFALGDRGPGSSTCNANGRGGISITTSIHASEDYPIPCGRNPDTTQPGAYVFAGPAPTLTVYDLSNGPFQFPRPPSLRGLRPDLRTE